MGSMQSGPRKGDTQLLDLVWPSEKGARASLTYGTVPCESRSLSGVHQALPFSIYECAPACVRGTRL
jgi:hypothetical protein